VFVSTFLVKHRAFPARWRPTGAFLTNMAPYTPYGCVWRPTGASGGALRARLGALRARLGALRAQMLAPHPLMHISGSCQVLPHGLYTGVSTSRAPPAPPPSGVITTNIIPQAAPSTPHDAAFHARRPATPDPPIASTDSEYQKRAHRNFYIHLSAQSVPIIAIGCWYSYALVRNARPKVRKRRDQHTSGLAWRAARMPGSSDEDRTSFLPGLEADPRAGPSGRCRSVGASQSSGVYTDVPATLVCAG
jgi:hypothetical protein